MNSSLAIECAGSCWIKLIEFVAGERFEGSKGGAKEFVVVMVTTRFSQDFNSEVRSELRGTKIDDLTNPVVCRSGVFSASIMLASARALVRTSSRLHPSRPTQLTSVLASSSSSLSQCRAYASKSKSKGKEKEKDKSSSASNRNKASLIPDREAGARGPHATSSSNLIPGSQQVLIGEAPAEYEKADAKMKSAVDWFRRECAAMEMQGSGRVTPDVLKPVRVVLPESDGADCGLNEIATVGVRDGTTIIVTVFAENVSCTRLASFP